MDNETCRACKYFMQHYIISENRLVRIFSGHCTQSVKKKNHTNTKACEMFTSCAADIPRIGSRRYLARLLLEYALTPDAPAEDGK